MEVVAALFIFFTAVLILQNRKLVKELETMDARVLDLETKLDMANEENSVVPLNLDKMVGLKL